MFSRINEVHMPVDETEQELEARRFRNAELVLAVKKFDRKKIELLIHDDSIINSQDLEGFTALHFAAMRRDEVLVKALMEAGAFVTIKNKHNRTPVDYYFYQIKTSDFKDGVTDDWYKRLCTTSLESGEAQMPEFCLAYEKDLQKLIAAPRRNAQSLNESIFVEAQQKREALLFNNLKAEMKNFSIGRERFKSLCLMSPELAKYGIDLDAERSRFHLLVNDICEIALMDEGVAQHIMRKQKLRNNRRLQEGFCMAVCQYFPQLVVELFSLENIKLPDPETMLQIISQQPDLFEQLFDNQKFIRLINNENILVELALIREDIALKIFSKSHLFTKYDIGSFICSMSGYEKVALEILKRRAFGSDFIIPCHGRELTGEELFLLGINHASAASMIIENPKYRKSLEPRQYIKLQEFGTRVYTLLLLSTMDKNSVLYCLPFDLIAQIMKILTIPSLKNKQEPEKEFIAVVTESHSDILTKPFITSPIYANQTLQMKNLRFTGRHGSLIFKKNTRQQRELDSNAWTLEIWIDKNLAQSVTFINDLEKVNKIHQLLDEKNIPGLIYLLENSELPSRLVAECLHEEIRQNFTMMNS